MKNLIIIAILALSFSISFSQPSSASLLKEMNSEMNSGQGEKSPEEKELIRARYWPLIEAAIEREENAPPALGGATVSYNGDQGTFKSKGLSTAKGADAYAIVATADANAYLVRQMANGASATVTAPNVQVGMEGTIVNKYSFRELEVIITGTNAGSVYRKTFILGGSQSVTDYLLPGTYQAQIRGIGINAPPVVHNFTVNPAQTHSFNGRNVFWGLYGGSTW